jgi:phosphopantothenoylcysteine synthetase/decarboxylase
MGLYTFQDFQDYLSFRHGRNDAFTAYYPIWINLGYKQLATIDRVWAIKRSMDLPELETDADKVTVSGTAYIDTPTDCVSVIELYDATNNVRLDWYSWPNYVANTDRYTNTGKPTQWIRRGNKIFLYPTPDDVYTIRVYYRKLPAPLTAGASVSILGAEWDDIILELADYQSRMWTREYDVAKTIRDAATARIAELMTIYSDEEKARRERMQPDEQGLWPTY